MPATLDRPKNGARSRDMERGYLIDDRNMSDRAAGYMAECLRNQLPSVVAHPWRRHWYALRVDMPASYRLSSQAEDRLGQHIADARDSGFRHPIGFLPGGFTAWGIPLERVRELAEVVATIVNDPDQTDPSQQSPAGRCGR